MGGLLFKARYPPIYRVFQTGLLIQALTDQGELAAAEEALAAVDAEADRPALNATLLRFARGRLRLEQGRVAEGLVFITARTVEGHLTSVFRKLQLDSRNGLSAVLGNDVLVSA